MVMEAGEKLSRKDPPGANELDPSSPKRKAFRLGVWLIGMSFGALPLYFVIPFLSVSLEAKVRIGIVAWIFSSVIFCVGMLLSGKDGYLYLRGLLRSPFRKP